MGNYVKGLLVLGNMAAGLALIDKVQPIVAIGFIGINVFLIIMLAAHISRYIHNIKRL